ncbi:HD domain-containing protein [Allomuricauda sp. SCSIO 65647]|uniref:HD domain-containing protein n=1 Tax=Allomuricauda sp. SCSIO 65647 TaxID=2908843 RepID=UPI001F1A9496|nr:HD domain-containing protein [Muricauda sp. SCSIO 65647]UJH68890.1 HD domain-containing protein [Muricauda sp. SCSIO 65647]
MTNSEIIEKTIAFVKETLKGAEGGHDWFHIQRVFNNTLLIAKDEQVDVLVVSLAALLHDIADAKFHNGDETIGPKMAEDFLRSLPVADEVISHVKKIIENISFKNSLTAEKRFTSKELKVVQDADRLDAMGAIGIARAFNYGGYKGRQLYNPKIAPRPDMTKEAYKNSNGPTINHFYEKLLLLKDKMNTKAGKKLAEQRHQFMLNYLERFFEEWNGQV